MTGAKTLEECAGYTLKERARFFHRNFLNKTIAITSLRKLYLKHGIKRKKIRQVKSSEYRARADYKYKCRALSQVLDEVRREGRKIIFLDEINFTKLSLPPREWSNKHSNLAVESADVYCGYRSVMACMTEERGMENL